MTYGHELQRKLVHIVSAVIPILYWATDRPFMLCVLIPLAVIALVAELLRHLRPNFRLFIDRWLGHMLRDAEAHTLTGATYVTLASLLTILLYDKPIAVSVLLFLQISDALASLIGIRFGKARFLGKSLAGSTAFFVSAGVIGVLVFPDRPALAISGALVGTIVEALPLRLGAFKVDDNLSIPLITGAVMTMLQEVCGL
jgi:dolichol kinase